MSISNVLHKDYEDLKYGIRHNFTQFTHQLIQVFFVGMTIGMTRTVIPALAESEFGVQKNSFLMLMSFVVAFGFVKGSMNFVAGRMSEKQGRRRILLLGWLIAFPIPVIIFYANHWYWIVFATILLGINQGFTWSMTQTSKLDITRADQRGLTIGLNEFAGYFGVALAGVITGYMAGFFGPRMGLLIFGTTVVAVSMSLTLIWVKETIHWSKAEIKNHDPRNISKKSGSDKTSSQARYFTGFPDQPTTMQMFKLMSFQDKRMAAFSQAGLVEKFVDALIWVFYPLYFYNKGLTVAELAWVVGIYGFVWGGSQFFTGKLSDHIGRMKPIIWGMWICGFGTGMMVLVEGVFLWSVSAAITGFGMALLYPNLLAAVSDIARPSWRGSAIGIYRFWRDLGYGIGALLLGLIANITGSISSGFIFVSISMFVSGLMVWIFAEETHPGLNPAPGKDIV